MESIPLPITGAVFDFALLVSRVNNSLEAQFRYVSGLFKPETIDRISVYFIHALETLVMNPQTTIMEIAARGYGLSRLVITYIPWKEDGKSCSFVVA